MTLPNGDEDGPTDPSSESGEQQQQRPGMAGTGRPSSAREIYEAGRAELNRQSLQRGSTSNQMRRQPSQRGGGGRGGGPPSRAASQRRSTSAPRGGRGRGGGSRRPGRGDSMRLQHGGGGGSSRRNVEGGGPTRHPSARRGGASSYRGSAGDLEAGFRSSAANGNAMRKRSMMSHRSSLDRADDPFAEREGKALTWRNINMTLEAGRDAEKNPSKQLLADVWGEVPQKEITAIMGPSGAGKTSLLNILAGRARSRGRLAITSDVRLNNYEVDPTKLSVRKQIAFVAQDDSLQVTSTPREAIRFSAKLRLPRSTTDRDLDRLTRRMIQELGLEHCADTMVGGALIKGISGGERKRTSVGVELVTKPALVFLDGEWFQIVFFYSLFIYIVTYTATFPSPISAQSQPLGWIRSAPFSSSNPSRRWRMLAPPSYLRFINRHQKSSTPSIT